MVASLLEKDKNMYQETNRLWGHISSRYYDFKQHVLDADGVLLIYISEILNYLIYLIV